MSYIKTYEIGNWTTYWTNFLSYLNPPFPITYAPTFKKNFKLFKTRLSNRLEKTHDLKLIKVLIEGYNLIIIVDFKTEENYFLFVMKYS